MSKEKKHALVGFHCYNHSQNSGYDMIAKYLPFEYISGNKLPFINSKFNSIRRIIFNILFEIKIILNIKKYDTLFYLYPELHLYFSIFFNRKAKKIGTIHLNLDWLVNYKNKRLGLLMNLKYRLKYHILNKFDTLIVLSTFQKKQLQTLFPNKNIEIVLHGIEEIRIKKSLSITNSNSIITVGSNYRDMDIYENILKYAITHKPNWKFIYVGLNQENKSRFLKYSNLEIKPFLSEEQYFDLLNTSTLLFLPLTFATANNAILEAYSVGLPVLVSDIEGVKDYYVSTTNSYTNLEDAIKSINQILENENKDELRTKTFEDGKKFLWENITKSLYPLFY